MRLYLIIIVLLTASTAQAQQSFRSFNGQRDGKHSVAFSPFGFIAAYEYANPAFGFDYEYILSQDAGIGLRVPFAVGYWGPEQGFGSGYKYSSFYFAPGVRFHAPFGRRAEFATGPGVLLGNMHFTPYDYYPAPGITRSQFDYPLTGLIVDNSLNVYNRHFLFGFDARVGTLLERHEGTRFFIHVGIHFGGKF